MIMPNYDDPKVENCWCDAQRAIVTDFLRLQTVNHGRIGDWPAWHVVPYAAIWAVESAVRPDWIGWWSISGDLPTDYISSAEVSPPQHPRKAMRVIAEQWLKQVEAWNDGRNYEGIRIAGPHSHREWATLLGARASLLLDWSNDDSVWEEA